MEFLPKQHWQCSPKSIENCCYLGSKLYLTPVTESHVMKRSANTRAASQRLNHCIWNEKFIRLQSRMCTTQLSSLFLLNACKNQCVIITPSLLVNSIWKIFLSCPWWCKNLDKLWVDVLKPCQIFGHQNNALAGLAMLVWVYGTHWTISCTKSI